MKRFFQGVASAAGYTQPLTPTNILALTHRHLQCPYPTCEVESIFPLMHAALDALSTNDADFNKKYDAVVFGTIVLARMMEQAHYTRDNTHLYTMTCFELKATTGMRHINAEVINYVGEQVLNGKMPFKAEYLQDAGRLLEHVPLLRRLQIYRPEIIGPDETLTERESNQLKLIEAQRLEIAALKRQLSATTTQAEQPHTAALRP